MDEGHANAIDFAYDKDERLHPYASLKAQHGLLNTPLFNAYLLHFRHRIEVRLGLNLPKRRPGLHQCTIALSHDVDVPIDPGAVRHALRMTGALLAMGRARRSIGLAANQRDFIDVDARPMSGTCCAQKSRTTTHPTALRAHSFLRRLHLSGQAPVFVMCRTIYVHWLFAKSFER